MPRITETGGKACTGAWYERARLGEAEPFLTVMKCSGCNELVVFSDFHRSLPHQWSAMYEAGSTHEEIVRDFIEWVREVRTS